MNTEGNENTRSDPSPTGTSSAEPGANAAQEHDRADARPSRTRAVLRFAKRHPAMSLLSVGALGLVAGAEITAGALLGAGATVWLARRRQAPDAGPEQGGVVAGEPADVRHRAQEVSARAREAGRVAAFRLRTIVRAARGELDPAREPDEKHASPIIVPPSGA